MLEQQLNQIKLGRTDVVNYSLATSIETKQPKEMAKDDRMFLSGVKTRSVRKIKSG